MSNPRAVSRLKDPGQRSRPATAFYSEVLDIEMKTFEEGHTKVALFPVAGKHDFPVVPGPWSPAPATPGAPTARCSTSTAYADLTVVLDRVTAAIGTIARDKTAIGEHGFMGIFLYTEGPHRCRQRRVAG
jgi:predicted enzyme related to lactoylglutathione lyase